MKGYADRIQSCTTTHFEGVISVINPEDSWVARWQRTCASDQPSPLFTDPCVALQPSMSVGCTQCALRGAYQRMLRPNSKAVTSSIGLEMALTKTDTFTELRSPLSWCQLHSRSFVVLDTVLESSFSASLVGAIASFDHTGLRRLIWPRISTMF